VAMSSVMFVHGLLQCFVMVVTIGDRRPFLLGMPMEAWIRWPCNCWRSFTLVCGRCKSDLMSVAREAIFAGGSEMVCVRPSKSHPSISFCMDHRPSPCASFFRAMGSLLAVFFQGEYAVNAM